MTLNTFAAIFVILNFIAMTTFLIKYCLFGDKDESN